MLRQREGGENTEPPKQALVALTQRILGKVVCTSVPGAVWELPIPASSCRRLKKRKEVWEPSRIFGPLRLAVVITFQEFVAAGRKNRTNYLCKCEIICLSKLFHRSLSACHVFLFGIKANRFFNFI